MSNCTQGGPSSPGNYSDSAIAGSVIVNNSNNITNIHNYKYYGESSGEFPSRHTQVLVLRLNDNKDPLIGVSRLLKAIAQTLSMRCGTT